VKPPADLLITGFEPFGNWSNNPAGELARQLDGQYVEGCRITGRLLPVLYEHAARLAAEWAVEQPWRAILALGLRASQPGLSLERLAVNVRHSLSHDNAGRICRHEPIEIAGPMAVPTSWNNDRGEEALRQCGLPVISSYFAGTYICNEVMYAILRRLRLRRSRAPFAFIHVPLVNSGEQSLTMEALADGLLNVLRAALANL